MVDQTNINFALYEDDNEYLGIAEVTLPDVNYLTQQISGAGIAGNIDAVIPHVEAMTLGINFRTTTAQAVSLTEPRKHEITLRVAVQNENRISNELEVGKVKHVFDVIPKSLKAGKIAPASPGDASGEYTVRYWKYTIDGETVLEIDPLRFKFEVNGVDYLKPVKDALGK